MLHGFMASLIAAVNCYLRHHNLLVDAFSSVHSSNPFGFQIFTFVLGFVLVFRCQMAYGRFWEGRRSVEQMTTNWTDAVIETVVFDQFADKTIHDILAFRKKIISLFSLLHACALSSLNDRAVEMRVLEGIDAIAGWDGALEQLNSSRDSVHLVMTWVQQLTAERLRSGGVSVPAPIASRIWEDLNTGMVGLKDAGMIHATPFPFPYAQLISVSLIVLVMTCGFVLGSVIDSYFWTIVMTMLSVVGYKALNSVAIELEDPFGEDANDLPLSQYQDLFNTALTQLLHQGEEDETYSLSTAGFSFHYPRHGTAAAGTSTQAAAIPSFENKKVTHRHKTSSPLSSLAQSLSVCDGRSGCIDSQREQVNGTGPSIVNVEPDNKTSRRNFVNRRITSRGRGGVLRSLPDLKFSWVDGRSTGTEAMAGYLPA